MPLLFLISILLGDEQPVLIQGTGIFDYLLPQFVAVDSSEEKIYIADRKENLIHLYRLNGERIKTFGGRGDGPDKFGALFQIRFHDEKLYAVDRLKQSVVAFDEDGTFVSRYRPGRIFFGFELGKPISSGWLCADKENLILVDKSFANSRAIIGDLVEKSHYDLATLQNQHKILRPGEPVLRFDVSKDGKQFFVYRPGPRMRVEVWDAEKLALERVIETDLNLPKPSQAWADSRLENYLETVGPDRFGNPRKTKAIAPDYLPGVFMLWVEWDNTLHVLTGEYLLDKKSRPLVFDFEGKAVSSGIPFKNRTRIVGKVGDQYLVTLSTSQDDEIGIALVQLDRLTPFLETIP